MGRGSVEQIQPGLTIPGGRRRRRPASLGPDSHTLGPRNNLAATCLVARDAFCRSRPGDPRRGYVTRMPTMQVSSSVSDLL
ncbi:hypothetical protein GCM10010206_17150 [Streptomyces cinerochromogenes]|nr:hypothetical protein GCM10010206_17150 [Streptomyces cinerochromogenes]